MKARIYKPTRNTMQSGRGRLQNWVLEYENETPRGPEPLMGWTASGDTLNQVVMGFDTLETAIGFAEKKGIDYTVTPEKQRKVTPRSYADNFN